MGSKGGAEVTEEELEERAEMTGALHDEIARQIKEFCENMHSIFSQYKLELAVTECSVVLGARIMGRKAFFLGLGSKNDVKAALRDLAQEVSEHE